MGDGNSDILSDNGSLNYVTKLYQADASVSGDDIIDAADGNYRVFSGDGDDIIRLGDGDHVVLADTGVVDDVDSVLVADIYGNGDDIFLTI